MPDEYELLDLDDGRKLERFGRVSTVRPAPAARGPRQVPAGAWDGATAAFEADGESGRWRGVESDPGPVARAARWARVHPASDAVGTGRSLPPNRFLFATESPAPERCAS